MKTEKSTSGKTGNVAETVTGEKVTGMSRGNKVLLVVLTLLVMILGVALLYDVKPGPAPQVAVAVASEVVAPTTPALALPPMADPQPRRLTPADLQRLQGVQQKLRDLTANGRQPEPMEVDPILQELITIQGSPIVGGVDLRVLRQNLLIASKLQKIAYELEAEIKKPNPDQKKIAALQASLVEEQRGLQMNIMPGTALPQGVSPASRIPQAPQGGQLPRAGQ
ncbi:hypothetical protein AGMMS50289_14630 [Betaproteobacteria bacterium]|nr:hypothetical protein FACS1894101_2180 [Betaproteobacteria bacterium]GHU44936.1 hypothetical protein AGMMS50289_14630 [Betaproteobacteria bacterium]